jgi:exopolysaccharide biosynthesis protein
MQSVNLAFSFLKYISSKSKPIILNALFVTGFLSGIQPGRSIGLIGPHVPMHGHLVSVHGKRASFHVPENKSIRNAKVTVPERKITRAKPKTAQISQPSKKNHRRDRKGKLIKEKPPAKPVVYLPQNYIDQLKANTLHLNEAVVYRGIKGPLSINLLDINLLNPRVKVRPILAGDSFNHLRDVSDDAKNSHALAAVNANYFKRNGTPLGTLIVDGEWVAGPLYDRVSLGLARDGTVQIDRVKFGGTLETSSPEAPRIWVNNINQPRRSGCHIIAYTRRWGNFVRLDYSGCIIALDARGRVVDKNDREMTIPWGGMVLTDSKDGELSKLRAGDETRLTWQIKPDEWRDVVQAVSGGPLLIKDGQLFVDLKDECFCKSWSGSGIRARTAAAVTADHHLLLVTIEGPHTLWDLAKFLQKLGAVDALNLDGGGSTTMVVNGATVTRASSASERRVASAFGVFVDPPKEAPRTAAEPLNLRPTILRTGIESGTPNQSAGVQHAPVASAPNPIAPIQRAIVPSALIPGTSAASIPVPHALVQSTLVQSTTDPSAPLPGSFISGAPIPGASAPAASLPGSFISGAPIPGAPTSGAPVPDGNTR